MTAKAVSNKEKLQDLLDKIKEIKRIPQGRISKLAGYETENYLSEIKSTGEISDNVIKAVETLYQKAKANPEILEKGYKETGTLIQDAGAMIINNQVEIIAENRVILSILAEIQAPMMKEKTLPTQLRNTYQMMVEDVEGQVRKELGLK